MVSKFREVKENKKFGSSSTQHRNRTKREEQTLQKKGNKFIKMRLIKRRKKRIE